MKVVIVDDDVKFMDKVEALCRTCLEKNHESISIYRFTDGEELLEDGDLSVSGDLYLLDVEMPRIDGLQLGEKLLSRCLEAKVVYLTSHEKYAYKSIKLGAFYYILKSEYMEELPRVLERILRKKREDERMHTIKDGNKLIRVRMKEIRYVTKDGKYAIFHYRDKEASERSTLEEIYQKLPKEKFVFIGKGQIINLDHVMNIQGNKIELTGNVIFKISRVYYPSAMEVLTKYLGRE